MKMYMAMFLNTKTYITEYAFVETSAGVEKAKEMILDDKKENGEEGHIISVYEIKRVD